MQLESPIRRPYAISPQSSMLRRCTNHPRADPDDVVLIDIESNDLTNVIIIEDPEDSEEDIQQTIIPSESKGHLHKKVICLTDDDSDVDSDFNWSKERSFQPSNRRRMRDENRDDCEFVRESKAPLKLSKCRRTYSGRSASPQNRYGLTSDSETSLSDSDSELIVDSFGKLQEEWEKASSRRKYRNHNAQFVVDGIESTSRAELQRDRGHACNDSSSSSSLRNEDRQNPYGVSSFHDNSADDLDIDFQDKVNNLSSDPCASKSVSYGVKSSSHINYSSVGKGDCLDEDKCSSSGLDGNDAHCGSYYTTNYNSQCTKESTHECSSSEEKIPFSGGFAFENHESCFEHNNNGHILLVNKSTPSPGETSSRNISCCEGIGTGKGHIKGIDEAVLESNGSSLITEKERLKETDEYKKALEEELASRQRAIQIQAEEAQQLRRLVKRKKAERMRLLDMERRQKERLDEMRETQKKDEENMNTKDVIRNQVRRELSKIEATCHDMVSLLQGLGIVVGSSPSPLLNEVRTAYKKALLTFHPDRASRGDIRQQVEAEEKFKLISRMKEKYLPNL
ncbi:unnamed protein product [Cuscuta epithymum]|uniref:J domain-containing protein n=2 Tax=Cuscuta epithymum TaxID=186058 RepID=A0AAV0ELA4_9ASTE|nr:unnamed protein product [Cuscuta epithymum]